MHFEFLGSSHYNQRRKNCECGPCHSLFKGHKVIVNNVALNCQVVEVVEIAEVVEVVEVIEVVEVNRTEPTFMLFLDF